MSLNLDRHGRDEDGIRILRGDETALLAEHLLRLDHYSRRNRFHGMASEGYIRRYAAGCGAEGVTAIAWIENGLVRASAELHAPGTPDGLPEAAFSVEAGHRRKGLGSLLFERLIAEAAAREYDEIRITTGSDNDAMKALAAKFGAVLTFAHGEASGKLSVARSMAPMMAA